MGKLKTFAAASGLAALLYWGPDQGIMFIQKQQLERSPKLETDEQFVEFMLKETKRISPNNKRLIIPLMSENSVAQSFLWRNEIYMIEIGGRGKNEYAVRHELYHILSGDCDDMPAKSPFLSRMQYRYYETKALVYDLIDKKF